MQGDSEFCGDGQKRGCGGGGGGAGAGAGGEEAEEAEWKQRIPCLSSSMSGFARNERWETKSERKFQSERDMRIIEWCGLIPYMLWLVTRKPNSSKLSPKKRRCWATSIERLDLEYDCHQDGKEDSVRKS
ncbi:hypothetical protein NC652_032477 [Populus alba x Populus x berolinensis]|nr:hypothetical protein NC652_032477 [Populus alba x Populus x berolinensis]